MHLMPQLTTSRMMAYVLEVQVAESNEFICSFWELEVLGITDALGKPHERSATISNFESIISFLNGRYEMALPWKDGFEFANNRQVAITQLERLL